MQCQAMVLDSTTFARQQPRYIEGDKTREERLSTLQQAWAFPNPLTVNNTFFIFRWLVVTPVWPDVCWCEHFRTLFGAGAFNCMFPRPGHHTPHILILLRTAAHTAYLWCISYTRYLILRSVWIIYIYQVYATYFVYLNIPGIHVYILWSILFIINNTSKYRLYNIQYMYIHGASLSAGK